MIQNTIQRIFLLSEAVCKETKCTCHFPKQWNANLKQIKNKRTGNSQKVHSRDSLLSSEFKKLPETNTTRICTENLNKCSIFVKYDLFRDRDILQKMIDDKKLTKTDLHQCLMRDLYYAQRRSQFLVQYKNHLIAVNAKHEMSEIKQ